MMNKTIEYISFWKRNASSVDKIERVKLYVKGKKMVDEHGKSYPFSEWIALVDSLFDVLKIEETDENYKAFLYESDSEDFSIKFFLEIAYSDGTYLAVKGIHPFKQNNYKEIQNLFAPYLS